MGTIEIEYREGTYRVSVETGKLREETIFREALGALIYAHKVQNDSTASHEGGGLLILLRNFPAIHPNQMTLDET